MAYLGQGPFQEFTNPPTKDSFTGDGSTVAFDMALKYQVVLRTHLKSLLIMFDKNLAQARHSH